jgi:transcriptional regulator with XRE-family HTH domain
MEQNIETHCSKVLKDLRRRKGLTLEEFEKFSGGKVKAVVLGSYERGTRAISLARLEQLAQIYEVPIEYFFLGKNYKSDEAGLRCTFDLRRIAAREELDGTLINVKKFLFFIVKKRRDWNGEVLTIRGSDTDLLATLSETDNSTLKEILNLNGFLIKEI